MKKSFFDTIPGVIRLDSRVAIYVPSTTDIDHPTDNRRQVEEVAAKLSAMFGGATATEIVAICHKIKREMKQEAVSLEVDGELFLV